MESRRRSQRLSLASGPMDIDRESWEDGPRRSSRMTAPSATPRSQKVSLAFSPEKGGNDADERARPGIPTNRADPTNGSAKKISFAIAPSDGEEGTPNTPCSNFPTGVTKLATDRSRGIVESESSPSIDSQAATDSPYQSSARKHASNRSQSRTASASNRNTTRKGVSKKGARAETQAAKTAQARRDATLRVQEQLESAIPKKFLDGDAEEKVRFFHHPQNPVADAHIVSRKDWFPSFPCREIEH